MGRRLLALLLPLAFATGCASLKAPPNFDAKDALAFHVNQVTNTLDTLADIVIQAEKQKLISPADKLAVLKAESIANKACKDLLLAVRAGEGIPDSKARAIAIIKEVLQDVPPQLGPKAQEIAGPYIATLNALLGVLGQGK